MNHIARSKWLYSARSTSRYIMYPSKTVSLFEPHPQIKMVVQSDGKEVVMCWTMIAAKLLMKYMQLYLVCDSVRWNKVPGKENYGNFDLL